jgi:hypothetical protein
VAGEDVANPVVDKRDGCDIPKACLATQLARLQPQRADWLARKANQQQARPARAGLQARLRALSPAPTVAATIRALCSRALSSLGTQGAVALRANAPSADARAAARAQAGRCVAGVVRVQRATRRRFARARGGLCPHQQRGRHPLMRRSRYSAIAPRPNARSSVVCTTPGNSAETCIIVWG